MRIRGLLRAVGVGLVIVSSLAAEAAHADDKGDGAPLVLGQPDQFGGYASTHVIVQVKPGVVPVQTADGAWTLARVDKNVNEGLDQPSLALAAALKVRGSTGIQFALSAQPKNVALAQRLGLDRYYRIDVPQGTDTLAMVAELAKFSSLIERAVLDGIGGIATVPNDVDFPLQYDMHNTGQTGGTVDADIDAPECWKLHTGSASITVAVLDTGVQNDHPDLIGRVTLGPPTYTCSPTPCAPNSYDMHGHGTHVTGILAANTNNAVGVAGMDRACQILGVRVTSNTGASNTTACANGVIWATDNGADIISMSLQYSTNNPLLADAVVYAYDSGVLPIAAVGNSPGFIYPGAHPKCMAVGATDKSDVKWVSSNTGPQLDVVAPGVDIYGLWNNSGYTDGTPQLQDGTSMATPHVSGLAALIRSYNPALSVAQIEQLLRDTAEDKGAPGFDTSYGWGRINAYEALLAATPVVGDATGDGQVNIDDLFAVIATWGPCPAKPDPCPADLDGDGDVDIDDLFIVIANWD